MYRARIHCIYSVNVSVFSYLSPTFTLSELFAFSFLFGNCVCGAIILSSLHRCKPNPYRNIIDFFELRRQYFYLFFWKTQTRKLYPFLILGFGMNCGDCGGKGCCGSEENETTLSQLKHDSLFITFKVFPPNSNVAVFTLST